MLLMIVHDAYIEMYGGKYFVSRNGIIAHLFMTICDYVIRFEGGKMEYLKNRSGVHNPFTEKEISFMLLSAKDRTLRGP